MGMQIRRRTGGNKFLTMASFAYLWITSGFCCHTGCRCADTQIILVFLWGGMNSLFLYEFTVCSMGSILANIADNLLNIDYAMSIMVLGSGITAPGS